MNKKAIELSINFLVILIITLVVFGMAMYLLRMFFNTADAIKDNIDTQAEKEIQRILFTGERVAMPIKEKTIKRGSSDVFGLGVLNINSGPSFKIVIEDGPIILKDNTRLDVNAGNRLGYISEYVKTISNNDHTIVSIPVRVPRDADIGKYILNVKVYDCGDGSSCESETYDDSVHKIYINSK